MNIVILIMVKFASKFICSPLVFKSWTKWECGAEGGLGRLVGGKVDDKCFLERGCRQHLRGHHLLGIWLWSWLVASILYWVTHLWGRLCQQFGSHIPWLATCVLLREIVYCLLADLSQVCLTASSAPVSIFQKTYLCLTGRAIWGRGNTGDFGGWLMVNSWLWTVPEWQRCRQGFWIGFNSMASKSRLPWPQLKWCSAHGTWVDEEQRRTFIDFTPDSQRPP